MTYRTEFPDFDDHEHAAKAMALAFSDDTSWKNDRCPSFTCDVFVLWIDYADPTRREFPSNPRFMLTDEGESVLETDDWEDVRAFVQDGKRDFPEYVAPPWYPDEQIEYSNGIVTKVVHIDGPFAILRREDGTGYVLAEGNREEFGFVREGEDDEQVSDLNDAMAQLAAARAAS